IDKPTRANNRRIVGSERPTTFEGSPSMPSTNQPPSPSIVKAPATRNDSPLDRYAVSSTSVGRANMTVVAPNSNSRCVSAPSRSRIVQCPVYNTPERPDMVSHCRRASSIEAGFPRSAPSMNNIESQPTTTQFAVTAGSRSTTTWSAFAAASAFATSPGAASGPCAARTASSSTPDTTTSGSIPAWRNTIRLPGEADASTTRVIGGYLHASGSSTPHVRPLNQRHQLPADGGEAQFVDRMAPQVELLRARFDAPARRGAQHRHQRGDLLGGGLTLDDLDLVDGLRRRVVDRHRPNVADLGDVRFVVAHSGMFPCFLGGVCVILRSSSRSAVAT